MKQIAVWKSEFGDAYTERNVIEPISRGCAFREMLMGLKLRSVLEVGCNRGHNLTLIQDLSPGVTVFGIEPNDHARNIAKRNGLRVHDCTTEYLSLPDDAFDLVFTAGVLIHVPLESLRAAQREIARVSRRYVLAIEYFAEKETPIPYRGHNNLLWKRDFLAHYLANVPKLTLLRTGDWGEDSGFDRSRWWLLEKSDWMKCPEYNGMQRLTQNYHRFFRSIVMQQHHHAVH
jgi:pseudaminic acid biosynthesis-associated methylase